MQHLHTLVRLGYHLRLESPHPADKLVSDLINHCDNEVNKELRLYARGLGDYQPLSYAQVFVQLTETYPDDDTWYAVGFYMRDYARTLTGSNKKFMFTFPDNSQVVLDNCTLSLA